MLGKNKTQISWIELMDQVVEISPGCVKSASILVD